MLGVGGAGGLGFFFLLELIPGVPPTRLMCGFFFLVLRDSELFVPAPWENRAHQRDLQTQLPRVDPRAAKGRKHTHTSKPRSEVGIWSC